MFPSFWILSLIVDVRWCPRIFPLHFDRSRARSESAFLLSLMRKMSPRSRIIDVASKILVPLGMIISLDLLSWSNAAKVALAAFTL